MKPSQKDWMNILSTLTSLRQSQYFVDLFCWRTLLVKKLAIANSNESRCECTDNDQVSAIRTLDRAEPRFLRIPSTRPLTFNFFYFLISLTFKQFIGTVRLSVRLSARLSDPQFQRRSASNHPKMILNFLLQSVDHLLATLKKVSAKN